MPGYATSREALGAPDPETLALVAALEETLRDAPPPWTLDINAVRKLRAEGKGVLPIQGPLPEGRWEAFDAAALGAPGGPGRVRRTDPPGDPAPRGVFLHIHGGGWTYGAADQADGRCLAMAGAAGLRTLSVAYRLAPEHPWPACLKDCLAAARHAGAVADQLGGVPLFIGGDSAGGHLALCVLQRLRDGEAADQALFRRIAGAALLYGCFDLALTPSARDWGERALVLSTPIIRWFAANLLQDETPADSPRVSPLRASFAALPPALLLCGAADPLLDDTLQAAEAWRAAGGAAELALWPGAPHAFDYFTGAGPGAPVAAEVHARIAAFFEARLTALGV